MMVIPLKVVSKPSLKIITVSKLKNNLLRQPKHTFLDLFQQYQNYLLLRQKTGYIKTAFYLFFEYKQLIG
ncbi:hypothetical protein B6J67_00195 [Klebsiella quasipneumoniae]|nr:hypothetical protein B6J67_00195 [Klebsiella quasipneumoniae]